MRNAILLTVLLSIGCGEFDQGTDDMGFRTQRPDSQVMRQSGQQGVRIAEKILKLTPLVTGAGQYNRYIDVINPSSRLSMGIELFFEPQAPNSEANFPSNSYNSTWNLEARAIGQAISSNRLHEIPNELGVALPRSYEVASAVKMLRVYAFLNTPTDVGYIPGIWYARAYWEPVVEISDEELSMLFSRCEMTISYGADP